MLIAKVVGHVVATKKDELLTGFKLLTICPMESKGIYKNKVEVAIDAVGAGIGEEVLVVRGTAARLAVGSPDTPVDAAIVGIIDTIDINE
ncbi:Carbon dioxide concentrating mechanism protein CcmL [Pelotomaculum schinkii]|uniref:Carbon dioxide concentrating mechanism protein CcmL n=1 Tax=Pelotomaculum schinkii TaxID=78350 RepID=A0A4Y7R9T1_9FIRM|nr:EutN/CcmL family microcompartment protein [Pelotomaculum schinkii]TEB05411.1 Carbon dioxide concentrating mechanism protein CcmL [Pelotomaculum schinkii]